MDDTTYKFCSDDDIEYMKKRIIAFKSFVDDKLWINGTDDQDLLRIQEGCSVIAQSIVYFVAKYQNTGCVCKE